MRILKTLFDFYIKSSIHVGFAVLALVKTTYIMLNIPSNKPMAYFAFLGTIVGYNFVKYDALARAKKLEMRKQLKVIAFVSLISLLAAGFYFFKLHCITQIVSIVFLGLTLLYTLSFFPNRRNARNWKGIKIYIVALCWVGVTLILPLVNAGINITLEIYLKSIQRFILVFVLILIFEIIDLKNDDPYLQTVPQQIGVKRTKLLGYFLLIVFCVLEIFNSNIVDQWQNQKLIIGILISISTAFFVFFANENRSKYYTSFWVESLPVFWWVFMFLIL
jgi:hypothetical protein